MCGIIGIKNSNQAVQLAFEGLKKLEYRGYDSWGIAFQKNKHIFSEKKIGKISTANPNITEKSQIAIGHTRWATHGKVLEKNTHPIFSNNKKIAIVHNGIIENFYELKEELQKEITFETDTDTEVIVKLIEKNFNGNLQKAVEKTCKKLEGRYAFVVMHEEFDELIAVKNSSPLVLGKSGKEFFVASDLQAFPAKVKQIIVLNDQEMAIINSEIKILDLKNLNEVNLEKRFEEIQGLTRNEVNAFEHFMLKEILEQRFSILQAIKENDFEISNATKLIRKAKKIFFIGCGTAGKVGFLGKYYFSIFSGIKSENIPSSEFEHFKNLVDKDSVLIAISQSGETADTLEAIELAKSKHAKIISLINAEQTSMHRKSDVVIPVRAGIEKAVASTKATTGQIAIILLLSFALQDKFEKGKSKIYSALNQIEEKLNSKKFLEEIKEIAEKLKEKESIYIIGRGFNYPIALESAIKLQEVSYIHAHGFAGGELKHGPLALIEKGIPCISLLSNDNTLRDTLNNSIEIKSREALMFGIGPKSTNSTNIFDYFIEVPENKYCQPIINLITIQLLAYYTSIKKGINPDYPRNLAKSVTTK